MKRWIWTLLLIPTLLLGGTITDPVGDKAAGDRLTHTEFNALKNALINEINGALDDANLEDASITTNDLKDDCVTPAKLDEDNTTPFTIYNASFTNAVSLAATKKLYLDGGADTYIYEVSGNTLDIVAGGNKAMEFQSTPLTVIYGDLRQGKASGSGGIDIGTSTSWFDQIYSSQVIVQSGSGTGLYLDGGGNTYITEGSADNIQIYAGGNLKWYVSDVTNTIYHNAVSSFNGSISPAADNTYTCGTGSQRWSVVYAANGTIQTSVSSTKENVEAINEEDRVCEIAGATYSRRVDVDIPLKSAEGDVLLDENGKPITIQESTLTPPIMGFIADGLPEEAFAADYDPSSQTWVRSTENVYTSAVIGILCERVKSLESKLALLEQRLAVLEQAATPIEEKP